MVKMVSLRQLRWRINREAILGLKVQRFGDRSDEYKSPAQEIRVEKRMSYYCNAVCVWSLDIGIYLKYGACDFLGFSEEIEDFPP